MRIIWKIDINLASGDLGAYGLLHRRAIESWVSEPVYHSAWWRRINEIIVVGAQFVRDRQRDEQRLTIGLNSLLKA